MRPTRGAAGFSGIAAGTTGLATRAEGLGVGWVNIFDQWGRSGDGQPLVKQLMHDQAVAQAAAHAAPLQPAIG